MPGFQPFVGLFPLAFVDRDPVGPEDLAVDVAAREVGVRLEHICRQAPPHHQFDNALGNALVDQVRDAGMAEDVRGDVFLYPGPPCQPFELHANRAVRQRRVMLGDKDRHCRGDGPEGIVALPFDQEFPGHHQPDVPGPACLEVHVHHNAVVVEPEVAPFHRADLTDTEPALVEHHYDGPVPARGAGFDNLGDLIGCEEVGGNLGHGVVGRDLEAADLLFRDGDKLICDEPEVELLDDEDVVRDRVLLERASANAPAVFECCNPCIDRGHIVLIELADEAPPSDQRVGEFVGPFPAEVTRGEHLFGKGTDKLSITGYYDPRFQALQEGSLLVVGLEKVEEVVVRGQWSTERRTFHASV